MREPIKKMKRRLNRKLKNKQPIQGDKPLTPEETKNQQERAQWLQNQLGIVCEKSGMRIEAVNLPQLHIKPTREGTLQECVTDFNKKVDDKRKEIEKIQKADKTAQDKREIEQVKKQVKKEVPKNR